MGVFYSCFPSHFHGFLANLPVFVPFLPVFAIFCRFCAILTLWDPVWDPAHAHVRCLGALSTGSSTWPCTAGHVHPLVMAEHEPRLAILSVIFRFWLGLQPGQNRCQTTLQGSEFPFFGVFDPLGGVQDTHLPPPPRCQTVGSGPPHPSDP